MMIAATMRTIAARPKTARRRRESRMQVVTPISPVQW